MVKCVPGHAFWHRGGDCHLRFQCRVLEGDFVGMEAYRGIGVGTGITVFQVAFDGASNMSQLASNLMMTTCKQIYFKKIEIV